MLIFARFQKYKNKIRKNQNLQKKRGKEKEKLRD